MLESGHSPTSSTAPQAMRGQKKLFRQLANNRKLQKCHLAPKLNIFVTVSFDTASWTCDGNYGGRRMDPPPAEIPPIRFRYHIRYILLLFYFKIYISICYRYHVRYWMDGQQRDDGQIHLSDPAPPLPFGETGVRYEIFLRHSHHFGRPEEDEFAH